MYIDAKCNIPSMVICNVILAEVGTQNEKKTIKSGLSDYKKRKPSMAQKHRILFMENRIYKCMGESKWME